LSEEIDPEIIHNADVDGSQGQQIEALVREILFNKLDFSFDHSVQNRQATTRRAIVSRCEEQGIQSQHDMREEPPKETRLEKSLAL